MKRRIFYIPVIALMATVTYSCNRSRESTTSTFTNPVLNADYSDPDVVRAGDGYYMVASSFNCVPGLPVLHSNDLVHWSLKGYALDRLVPGAVCTFSYGAGDKVVREAGDPFTAREGMWIGAKIGFFALRGGFINDAGYADIDWFRLNTTD